MARIIDALEQFSDGNGQPLAGGYLKFFENKTTNAEPTYNDPDQTVVNPVQLPLDGEGRMSLNAYASVLCTVKLFNSADVQVDSEDDVTPRGGLTSGAAFANWNSTTNYQANISIVTGSDGCYYKSKINTVNIDPVVDFAAGGENWEKIYFNEFWSEFKTFKKGDRVTFFDDLKNYISVSDANLNNDPSTDIGTNWELDEPALDYVSGKTYGIGDKARSKIDNRVYISQLSQEGNEPSVDDDINDSANWLPADGKVTKPVNVTPADLDTDVSRNVTLIGDAYAVTGSTVAQEYSRYRIYADAGRVSVIYDSEFSTDLTSHVVDLKLDPATTFYWDILKKGYRTDPSELSTLTSFTTTINLSEVFDNVLFVGTGVALSVITTVDLNANSGTVWINNNDNVSSMRILDTSRGVGNAIIIDNISTTEVSEPLGLTAFNDNGFNVGTDAAYNGSTDNILSLTFKQLSKKYVEIDVFGNSTNRTVAHGLNNEVGFMLSIQIAGSSPAVKAHYCWFKGQSPVNFFRFADDLGNTAGSTTWNSTAPTSSEVSLGTNAIVNGTGNTYKMYLWAHNPSAGTFCGSYVGTGGAGNVLVLGFPVVNFLTVGGTNDWVIMDKQMGTSSHVILNAAAQSSVGGPDSFDSAGITLGAVGNDLGVTYFFKAEADPDLF